MPFARERGGSVLKKGLGLGLASMLVAGEAVGPAVERLVLLILLGHRLDQLPGAMDRLKRLGDIFAHLRKPLAATGWAGTGRRNNLVKDIGLGKGGRGGSAAPPAQGQEQAGRCHCEETFGIAYAKCSHSPGWILLQMKIHFGVNKSIDRT